MAKVCTKCKVSRNSLEFYIKNKVTGRRDTTCKPCVIARSLSIPVTDKKREYWKQYALKHRVRNLKRWTAANRLKRTGITQEQYDSTWQLQGGYCAICNRHESLLNKALSADHCHKTGVFRAPAIRA